MFLDIYIRWDNIRDLNPKAHAKHLLMQSTELSWTRMGGGGGNFVLLPTFHCVINILVLFNEKYLLEVGLKRVKEAGLSYNKRSSDYT